MLYNVPQYIDVEDKVAGPLTAKQLLWMFGMGAVLLILWTMLERTAFYLMAVPVVGAFVALAFYKPNGQPLISFVFHGLLLIVRPKIYTWEQQTQQQHKMPRHQEQQPTTRDKKVLTLEEITALSQTLDSEGHARDKKAQDLIARYTQKR